MEKSDPVTSQEQPEQESVGARMESSLRGKASPGAHREMKGQKPREQHISCERVTQTSHLTAGGIRKRQRNKGHKRKQEMKRGGWGTQAVTKEAATLYTRGTKQLFINKSTGGSSFSSFARDKQSCQQRRHHQPSWGRRNTQSSTALWPG